jgi:hypothetical protein
VDGKVLRGSGRHDGKPLQLLSAVTHHLRLTLDQIPIAEKSNEIPALQPLLQKVQPPSGVLITADALHGQQESARCITQDWGGDYLFGLKGNQSGILEKAQRLLTQQGFPPEGQWKKGHGRLDRLAAAATVGKWCQRAPSSGRAAAALPVRARRGPVGFPGDSRERRAPRRALHPTARRLSDRVTLAAAPAAAARPRSQIQMNPR